MSRIETIAFSVLLVTVLVLVGYVLASLPSQAEIQSVIQGISK